MNISQLTRILDGPLSITFSIVRSLAAHYKSSGIRGVPVVRSAAGYTLPYPFGFTRYGYQSACVHQRITGRVWNVPCQALD